MLKYTGPENGLFVVQSYVVSGEPIRAGEKLSPIIFDPDRESLAYFQVQIRFKYLDMFLGDRRVSPSSRDVDTHVGIYASSSILYPSDPTDLKARYYRQYTDRKKFDFKEVPSENHYGLTLASSLDLYSRITIVPEAWNIHGSYFTISLSAVPGMGRNGYDMENAIGEFTFAELELPVFRDSAGDD